MALPSSLLFPICLKLQHKAHPLLCIMSCTGWMPRFGLYDTAEILHDTPSITSCITGRFRVKHAINNNRAYIRRAQTVNTNERSIFPIQIEIVMTVTHLTR
jgi:hypothetical protein